MGDFFQTFVAFSEKLDFMTSVFEFEGAELIECIHIPYDDPILLIHMTLIEFGLGIKFD